MIKDSFGRKGLTPEEKHEIDYLVENCFIADINSGIKMLTKNLLQKVVKLEFAYSRGMIN